MAEKFKKQIHNITITEQKLNTGFYIFRCKDKKTKKVLEKFMSMDRKKALKSAKAYCLQNPRGYKAIYGSGSVQMPITKNELEFLILNTPGTMPTLINKFKRYLNKINQKNKEK